MSWYHENHSFLHINCNHCNCYVTAVTVMIREPSRKLKLSWNVASRNLKPPVEVLGKEQNQGDCTPWECRLKHSELNDINCLICTKSS